jgi:hypothetical protein
MDSGIAASVAAGAALLGSALTGLITYKVADREQRGRNTEELRVALVAYGSALDRLDRHIGQLPHPPRTGRALDEPADCSLA